MNHFVVFFCLFLSLLSWPCARAQGYRFVNINREMGTTMQYITGVAHDADGFVWAASRTGVLCIAGNEYRSYELPFASTNVMQVRLACRGNELVAATQNGELFRFNRVMNRFERWLSLSARFSEADWVTNLTIDSASRVWVSTSVGLFRCEAGSEEAVQLTRESCQLALVGGSEGLLFAPSAVFRLSLSTGALQPMRRGVPFRLSTVCYDPYTQSVWLGTYGEGLWQYRISDEECVPCRAPGLPKFLIRDILVADSTSLWIGYESAGIYILDAGRSQVKERVSEHVDRPSSLRGNGVFVMAKDAYRRIWVGTYSGGLQYTDNAHPLVEQWSHAVNDARSLSNDNVHAVLADSRDRVWIASEDGLSLHCPRTGEWQHFYTGRQQTFLSLTTDGRGHIFASTYGNGLYMIDEASGRTLRHFTQADAPLFGEGKMVYCTYADSEGNVWMGTTRSPVYCYEAATGKLKQYSEQAVNCFAEWAPGKLLMGCLHGLLLMDTHTGRTEIVLPDQTIVDMAVVGGRVWVCTVGNGVIGVDMSDGSRTRIGIEQGLPSRMTKSILAIDSCLWIGTDKGLCSYQIGQPKCLVFPTQPLLNHTYFTDHAACRLPDGKLAFGSSQGVIVFHPDRLGDVRPEGKIYFSDIRLAGNSLRDLSGYTLSTPIDSLKQVQVRYPQNRFTLSVMALGKLSRQASFAWKLEGWDKTWNTTGGYISYANLPAGNYTLMVRLYDGTLVQERTLAIEVIPPFWQTWWFRLLLALVVVGLFGWGLRAYTRRLHRLHADEKIRFFTRMAHDMRTSLMLIQAPLEQLRQEKGFSEWATRCIGLADEQTHRLIDTTTRLLDFEKLDIGREQPLYANVELVDLINRRVEAYRSYAAQRGIIIAVSCSSHRYWTQIDARMIERSIDNLLSNAVKYSFEQSRIEVDFDGGEKEWQLKITDHGMGIEKSVIGKLFREFYRSDNAINAQIVGSGIGLLMTQKYIELHGGTIRIDSRPGEGATFTMAVPQKQRVEPERVSEAVEKEWVCDDDRDEAIEGMRILLVEDNVVLREFMAHPLRQHFQVDTAEDGQQAWEKIQADQPDLVVSDVVMPHKDGFELCADIKRTPDTAHIPVILLTALGDDVDQKRGLELGADNYLVKPFDLSLLIARITSIIRNRRIVFQRALQSQGHEQRTRLANQANDEFIEKAIACVKANLSNESFDKDEFASEMAMSQSLLYKKVKALTNLSVVEFIREIRLSYALELLRSGQYTITEVSEMAGFNTPAYFSRVFKKHYGMTPSEMVS